MLSDFYVDVELPESSSVSRKNAQKILQEDPISQEGFPPRFSLKIWLSPAL